MIGLVDYEAGNLRSVETALQRLGASFRIIDAGENLSELDRLVIPGVGDANYCMGVLRRRGLEAGILDFFRSGKPILGICLGSHVVLDSSEEREAKCLGLIPGRAVRFPRDLGEKVPHMGWNEVTPRREHWLFAGIPGGTAFYFVHSYYPQPEREEAVIATSEYGITFPAAIEWENLVATQFHPEKSGELGLRMLSNFLARG